MAKQQPTTGQMPTRQPDNDGDDNRNAQPLKTETARQGRQQRSKMATTGDGDRAEMTDEGPNSGEGAAVVARRAA